MNWLEICRDVQLEGSGALMQNPTASRLRPSIQSTSSFFVSWQSDHFLDMTNQIFDFENSRSRSWPVSKFKGTLKPNVKSVFVFRFVAIRIFFAETYKLNIWFRKFKVKLMVKVKIESNIRGLVFNQFFLWYAKSNIWPSKSNAMGMVENGLRLKLSYQSKCLFSQCGSPRQFFPMYGKL